MTAPEPTPTAEHIDAAALVRAIGREHRPARIDVVRDVAICACGVESSNHDGLEEHRAELIVSALTTPAAMLDALVRAGVLTEEQHCAHARAAQTDGDYRSYTCEDAGTHCPPPRLVTRWEVAP